MNKLATRLRIGEKIGLGFGAVGLIFLGVIWYYHLTLNKVVEDYQRLNAVYGERQSHAFAIEHHLGGMLSAADRFLLTRDTDHAGQTRAQAAALSAQAEELADIDAASRLTAAQLQRLTEDFTASFDAIVEAWRVRGLDENAGLQGAFRDAAHELEARAGHYNVDQPYLLLLQIRRREKDLGLRRDPQYLQTVQQLLDEMTTSISESDLPQPVKQDISRGALNLSCRARCLRRDRPLRREDRRRQGTISRYGTSDREPPQRPLCLRSRDPHLAATKARERLSPARRRTLHPHGRRHQRRHQ